MWDARVERILAGAEPALRRLAGRGPPARTTTWTVMGLWWKPTAGLAAAATALLLLTVRPAASPEPPPGSLSLSLIASQGDPVVLWGAFGVEADPVLASIVAQEQEDPTARSTPRDTPEGENR